jgi:threonine/homoserine/homoserine lactone efflux protein
LLRHLASVFFDGDNMILREFLLLAMAHWLALVSPGPDFFLLLRNALRHGRRHGVGTGFGIACANGGYIVLALTGFAVLQQSAALLMVMKLLASAYLGYLGWGSLRSGMVAQGTGMPPTSETIPSARVAGGGFWSGCLAGLFSGGLNPKNALFYLGLFTVMVDASTGMPIKMLYGAWMFSAVFLWDTAVVLAVSDSRIAQRMTFYLSRAEALAGAVLLMAALFIAVTTVFGTDR